MNQEIPREAIHAYNLYIHGEIDRRSFLDRVKKVAVSSVAAAAIVDQMMPNYAEAQQVKPDDTRLKTSRETVASPNGNGTTSCGRRVPARTSCRRFSWFTRTEV